MQEGPAKGRRDRLGSIRTGHRLLATLLIAIAAIYAIGLITTPVGALVR
jgi:hypothetical protein